MNYDLKYWLYGISSIERLQHELAVLDKNIENIIDPQEVYEAFTVAYGLTIRLLRFN